MPSPARNSGLNLRKLGEGIIEPREMDQLPVLNPALLPPHEREKLAELFELLCQADSEETEKALRQAIDETIATMY